MKIGQFFYHFQSKFQTHIAATANYWEFVCDADVTVGDIK